MNQCQNCFTCERGYSGQSCAPGGRAVPKIENFTYFVFLTNECNLRCSYCYATKTPRTMKREMLEKVAVFIAKQEKEKRHEVSIQFFGGEPTMMWGELVYFVHLVNHLFSKMGRTARWGMTTNGTLLNEDRLCWMRHHSVHPLFSIDGRRDTHNKHRLKADGSGSWDDIPIDLIAKYYPNNEIRPTIMPDTVENWYDDLLWFHSKEFFTIATEVAYEVEWNEEAMEKARRTYSKIADLYVRRKRANLPMWAKFIEDGRRIVKGPVVGPVCGTARNVVAIDSDGGLFACQRYASFSDPSLRIGDVEKGFDSKRLESTNSLLREAMHPETASGFFCDECPAQYRCRGGCNAMNHQVCGNRGLTMANVCKFQRMWTEIGLRALASTGELFGRLGGKDGRKR